MKFNLMDGKQDITDLFRNSRE